MDPKIELGIFCGHITDEVVASLSDAAPQPVWVCIATPGKFAGHKAGEFQLGAETFAQIIANFSAGNRRVAWDFEHASEADPTSGSIPTSGTPSQGWITDLKIGEDGCLHALTEWLEPARSYVKGKKYMFCSPTIRFGARDQKTGRPVGAKLTSVALTNTPFLSDLPPVRATYAASEVLTIQPPPIESAQQKVNLRIMTEEELAALRLDAKNKDAEIAALKAQVAELTATMTARLSDAETQLATFRKEVIGKDVEEAFAVYSTVRKLTDADKADMTEVRTKLPDTFARMYPKLQGAAAAAPKVLMSTIAAGKDSPQATPEAPTVPDVTKLAAKYIKDGMDDQEAHSRAYGDVQAALKALKGLSYNG